MQVSTISKSEMMSLQPAELAGELVQYMVNVVRFSLESTLSFLKAIKLPDVIPLSPALAMQRMNQIIATIFNYAQLQLISKSLTNYVRELSASMHLPTFFMKMLLYVVNHVNTLTNKFQSFVPILLLKLYFPSDFLTKNALPILNGDLSSGNTKEQEINLLRNYIQELIGTIEKDRQQHQQDVTRLTSLEEEGVKTIENVKRVKREFEVSVQDLLAKIEDETNKHQEEIDQLRQALEKEKLEAQEKMSKMTGEFEKQKKDLTIANEALTLLEIEEVKREDQKQKDDCMAAIEKEREAHREEVEKLQVTIEKEKTESEEKLSQLTKDFEAQKEKLLERIEHMRGDWTEKLNQLKTSTAQPEDISSIMNGALEDQKQEWLTQMVKEREQHKVEIALLTKSIADESVDELLREYAKQKEDLEKERDSIKQQVQEATEAQKTNFEREREELNDKIETLQTTINGFKKKAKASKILGTLNKALGTQQKSSEKTSKV